MRESHIPHFLEITGNGEVAPRQSKFHCLVPTPYWTDEVCSLKLSSQIPHELSSLSQKHRKIPGLVGGSSWEHTRWISSVKSVAWGGAGFPTLSRFPRCWRCRFRGEDTVRNVACWHRYDSLCHCLFVGGCVILMGTDMRHPKLYATRLHSLPIIFIQHHHQQK